MVTITLLHTTSGHFSVGNPPAATMDVLDTKTIADLAEDRMSMRDLLKIEVAQPMAAAN